jgi:hypothetical protein
VKLSAGVVQTFRFASRSKPKGLRYDYASPSRCKISARRSVKAERASTSSTPTSRAALMTSVLTCETNPIVGIAESAASPFIERTVPSGSVRALFKSSITRDGALWRMSSNAALAERTILTATPREPAAALIFAANIRSSTMARTTETV